MSFVFKNWLTKQIQKVKPRHKEKKKHFPYLNLNIMRKTGVLVVVVVVVNLINKINFKTSSDTILPEFEKKPTGEASCKW